ncbi:MAG: beta-glucuronidase [Opitutales bacterium]|nr:beta-glucuronidase [Opitutales bacterium]MCH8539332.1 beta-glucuronidase [Opitutales bacterium]
MLFPKETLTRSIVSLDGLWNFKKDPAVEEPTVEWARSGLTDPMVMAVPAAYNDLTQDISLRDHVGWVWYERTIVPNRSWQGQRLVLRFGAVAHHARVYLEGEEITRHKGGFLPFEVDITDRVNDQPLRLSVAVDNRLDWTCLPAGEVVEPKGSQYPEGFRQQVIHFDFFNYAGIIRPVRLQVLPPVYLQSMHLDPLLDEENTGQVHFRAALSGEAQAEHELLDAEGNVVASAEGAEGTLTLKTPKLWQPGEGYCYTFRTTLRDNSGEVLDTYPQTVGFRTVKATKDAFLINDKPFYFKGFGKHEDSILHGRGFDPVTFVKDLRLLGWIGANSFRTSHYPYAEEILNLCDEEGIVVIDESPAVGLWDHKAPVFGCGKVNEGTLEHHCEVMTDLINRDRHHPCVVMWSVSNEPASWEEASRPYFEKVAAHTRAQDPHRPICGVTNAYAHNDLTQDLFDVVCLNRYPAWYTDVGLLETIYPNLMQDLKEMYEKYQKPIIITEYGADTIAGFHADPPQLFSEEFQVAFLDEYHRAYDELPFVIGEHVWNFADFMTKQGITRIIGNRKGVFTRDRQPKAIAHHLRTRWHEEV